MLLLPIATARAQGDIHRCMGAGGIPVFTDRACTDVNATPALPPATVATVAAPAAPGIPAAPPTVLCAADLAHLKQAVVDAFAVRNPNRLAGLMLWNGDGQDTVVANIRLFSRLMARPLVGVTVEGAPDPDESDADPAAPATVHSPAHGEALSVQTEAEDGSGATERTHFGVVHRDGCLWLEPQE
ncbi:DUF4124 domain-containing protein [Dyella mobilis]|uniref:DUF4124 domain-containing protein n=1 Tax=Dyella mobilis TaxID=1849582 RepID=UPI001EF96537|nr:DUF4124 domain-containing protein [Dyella mobilis]